MTKISESSTQLREIKNVMSGKPLLKFYNNIDRNSQKRITADTIFENIIKYFLLLSIIPKEYNDYMKKITIPHFRLSKYLFSKCAGKTSEEKTL